MTKIKIAIIGCGIITEEAHLPALLRLSERIEIKAVCNRTKPKAVNIAEKLSLPEEAVWTDWKKMIGRVVGLDAVLIALPITMNHPVSRACCKAGLSVLCEKPAGMNNEEAEETSRFSAEYGVTYMTGENFHFEPRFRKAAELVKEGIIGKLHSTSWNLLSFMDKNNKYNKTQWRADNKYPGGYVLDGGVHFVHALQMIAGPVDSVFSHTASIDKDLGTMDSALSLMKHCNGVISSLNLGWRAVNDDSNLKLYGDKGTLIIKDDLILEMTPGGKINKHSFERENSFYLQWSAFLDSLEEGRPPALPHQMPVNDVKIIMAIIESGQTGKKISLCNE
ncbi:MAG: Gfo/Idh/MocA family oxidoreductase [Spirochaetaceae bacterium]|nr:Gfo/Idh/MocA family oxidoreductase [Spirochaetaceae bacterium]